MYKGIGKRVAMYPGIIQKSDDRPEYDYAFIIWFYYEKGRIIQKMKVLKDVDYLDAERKAKAIYRKQRPVYLILIFKYSNSAPETYWEGGNKAISEEWIQQQPSPGSNEP